MKIKEKVLKEVYKMYDKKNLLFGEQKIFKKAIDLTLAEVGKVNEEFIKLLKETWEAHTSFSNLLDEYVSDIDLSVEIDKLSKEYKQKLGIK